MDPAILKIVGQVAGIGGIALGVFLLIFRELIRRIAFPGLTKEHGYRVISMILILTFLLALAGIGAWVYVQRQSLARAQPRAPVPSSPSFVLTTEQPWVFVIENNGVGAVNAKIDSAAVTEFSTVLSVDRPGDGSETANLTTRSASLTNNLFTRVDSGSNPSRFLFVIDGNERRLLEKLLTTYCKTFGEHSRFRQIVAVLLRYEDVAVAGKHTRVWQVRWDHTCGFANDKPLSFTEKTIEEFEKTAKVAACLRSGGREFSVDETISEPKYRDAFAWMFRSSAPLRCP